MKVPVNGTTFVRDTKSHALLQSNRRDMDDYKMKRKMLESVKQKDEDINKLKEDVSSLKTDIEEIKQLLKGLAK